MDTQQTVYGEFPAHFRVEILRNLCAGKNGIQTGPFGSQLHQRDYVPVGTPIITVEHLGENRILHESLPRVSDSDRGRLAKYLLQDGDIVFSRVGSVDRRTLVSGTEEGWLFSGRCLRVRPDPSKVDSQYLSYFLGLEVFREYIRSIAVGATMPSLNTRILSDIPIVLPDISEQKAIAHVLGTLDNKIELNRRMNRTLEEMARVIFQDWFVDFGPTRAKMEGLDPYLPPELWDLFPDELVGSELGEIPEGWEVGELGEIIEILDRIRIPLNSRQRSQRQGPYPYYGAAGIMDYVDDFLFDGVFVLTGEDGSVIDNDGYPVVQYIWGQFWVNNHAHVMKGKNGVSNEYLYLLLKGQNIGAFVTGAVQPKLSQGNLKAVPIVKPDLTICQTFTALTDPIFSSFRHHSDESHTLSAQRDTLLPKLVSGEIPVATR